MKRLFKAIFIVVLTAYSCLVGYVYAQFELNFIPVQNPTTISDFPKGGYDNTGNAFSCPDVGNTDCFNGTEASTDPTVFYYERVDGYWHLIVGDPEQGFAQEVYTPIVGLFHSNTGGREPIFFTLNGNLEEWSGNGWDPLELNNDVYGPENSSFSGNGTGDPTKVIMRQVLGFGTLGNTGVTAVEAWTCNSSEFCQEFLKSQEGFKPIITQEYSDAEISIDFSLDMSAISYSDMTTQATMVNTISLVAPGIPDNALFVNAPSATHFDMATDSQDSVVTAGRYIYTPGSGWHDDGDGDVFRAFGSGTYEYVEGISDFQLSTDWASFYDATQNPEGSYQSNQARCENLTIAACTNPPSGF